MLKSTKKVHYNFDAKYTELASNSTGLEAQSHKIVLSSDVGSRYQVPRLPYFCLTLLQSWEFPNLLLQV